MTLSKQWNASTSADSLSEQVRVMEHVLSCMAHDLKNPLSIVRGNAQLAMMVSKEEKTKVCLHRIIDAVDAMTQTFGEIRCLRKPMENSMEHLNMVELARTAAGMVEPLAGKSGVVYQWEQQEEGMVYGNRDMLVRALVHLVRNAVEAMPHGGTLSLAVRQHEGRVHVELKDTGHGIPLDLQPKIFKEFITTKSGAYGWGLIIVGQVIEESHHGTVDFVSNENGTTFTITLPLG